MKLKFAIVDGKRAEATPKAKGICPNCQAELIAKCGQVKVWHWAHKGPPCDHWWKNETEWHRAWKGHFPVDWQEVTHKAESGEKHIADVKTDQGWVLEFQHSYLKLEERQARDAFYYPKLIWIVDGTRRKRDKTQFIKALNDGAWFHKQLRIPRVFIDECALVREWVGCRAPVFFDFNEGNIEKDAWLWCLLPGNTDKHAYIGPYQRAVLTELHCNEAAQKWQDFVGFYQDFPKLVSDISRGGLKR